MRWLSDRTIFQNKLFDFLHNGLKALLPVCVFLIVVFLELPFLAYILIVLSKWRILDALPRFWWSNLQINATDLIVGLSIVYFMSLTPVWWHQVIWLGLYLIWSFWVKSMKKRWGHFLQGISAQILGVSVLVYSLHKIETFLVLIGVWLISVLSVGHIVNGLARQKYHDSLIQVWGLFSVQLAWILFHWQIHFWWMSRLVFLQTFILTVLFILYTLHQEEKLTSFLKKQILISSLIVIVVVLLLSNFQTLTI